MELTQLHYFMVVAQTQHITRSAEILHIAQPSLTQSIHRLEDDLGVPLFSSKGRNIVLTEYGKYFYERLCPIMAELDALPEKLKIKAKLSSETIHMNVLAASAIVTEAIIDYKKDRRKINFQFLQNQQEELYDIEITTKMFYQMNATEQKNKFVCTEKIFLAVPNNEKYEGKTSIRLEDVMNEGFISLFGSKQFRTITNKFCHHAGFHPRIIFESDSPDAVRNMIAANMGVGFWPEFTWGTMNSDQVKLLEIEDIFCSRDIVISCNLNKTDNANVIEFFEFLKKYFESRRMSRQEQA